MSKTINYELEKYEAGNPANLLDQYNGSMDKIDASIKSRPSIEQQRVTGRSSRIHKSVRVDRN